MALPVIATESEQHCGSTNVPATMRSSNRDVLTIGYLSGDFREHPVAYLIAGLFEEHDRNRFRVVGYSYGSDDGSHIRQRIKTGFDRFVELNQSSDTESAQRITEDEVDILVDLTGHTRGQRLDILANRPAPVMAGCPVLTCVGEAFSARVAGSLLRSVGLPELVTTTWDEYQSMALDLARNPPRLAELRNRLTANREQTSLFKMDVFARNIEKAYVKMWAIHTAGELPRSFCV